MGKIISIVVIFTLLVGSYMLTLSSDSEQKHIDKTAKKSKNTAAKKESKKDIQIIYIDEKNSDDTKVSNGDNNKNPNPKKHSFSYSSENSFIASGSANESSEESMNENIIKTAKKIKEFVIKNALQKVSVEKGKNSAYTIYAKNSLDNIDLQQYEDKPPMVPTIISKKLPNGESFNVVVDSRIVQNNDTLYIAKNGNDGKPEEMIKVPVKEDVNTDDTNEQESENINNETNESDIRLIMPPSF